MSDFAPSVRESPFSGRSTRIFSGTERRWDHYVTEPGDEVHDRRADALGRTAALADEEDHQRRTTERRRIPLVAVARRGGCVAAVEGAVNRSQRAGACGDRGREVGFGGGGGGVIMRTEKLPPRRETAGAAEVSAFLCGGGRKETPVGSNAH